MSIEGVIGHEAIVRVLTAAFLKPAHGYLFYGPRGVGKRTVAEKFVAKLLNVACNTQHITSDLQNHLVAHPDFIRLTREEGAREIVIKQVRELLSRMHLTSARGGYKIALIEGADRLNEEGANALLKAVEEPSAKTVYIFLAEYPERLPATLRSRLVSMEFGRVKTEEIEKWLAAVDPHVDLSIAKMARGCPGVAYQLAFGGEDNGYIQMDWSAMIRVLLQPPLGKQLAMIETITQAVESQTDPEAAWQEALGQLMRALDGYFTEQPQVATQLGRGLARAWKLIGSAISPRLALEWALIPETAKEGRMIPRVMKG